MPLWLEIALGIVIGLPFAGLIMALCVKWVCEE